MDKRSANSAQMIATSSDFNHLADAEALRKPHSVVYGRTFGSEETLC
jgi:hypothetical protein